MHLNPENTTIIAPNAGMSHESTESLFPPLLSPFVLTGGARRAQRVAAKMKCKIGPLILCRSSFLTFSSCLCVAILETRTVGTEKVVTVVGTLKENAVLFDDMIDTGERIRLAAPALKAHGAVKVFACATHAVLSGFVESAILHLNNSY